MNHQPLLALFMLLVAPLAAAQGGLFYTGTVLEEIDASDPVEGCASFIPVYEATLEPAVDDADLFPAITNFVSSCTFIVRWVADQPFTWSGETTATAIVSCNVASVYLLPEFRVSVNDVLVQDRTFYGDFIADPTLLVTACAADTASAVHGMEWSLVFDMPSTSISPGDVIDMEFLIFAGPLEPPYQEGGPVVGNTHVKAGPSTQSGFFSASIPGPLSGGGGPQTFYQDLTGDAFAQGHSFGVATSDTYVFNWTGPSGPTITYEGSSTAGSVELTITDGGGATLVSESLSGDFGPETLVGGDAGEWQITFAYTDYVGSLEVAIEEIGGSSTPTPTPTGGQGTPTPTGGQGTPTPTGSGSSPTPTPKDDDKGSPGFGVFAFVATLGAALALRRRSA